MSENIARIMLVDDHTIFRSGLARLLSEFATFTVTAEAATIAEACRELAEKPDLQAIILDINLAGQNALEQIPALRAQRKDVPILIMSMYPPRQFAPAAYRAGANGYVTKDASPATLRQALSTVLTGQIWQHPDLLTAEPVARGGYPHERLTERELEILKRIAQGEALTDIANDMFLSNKTVSTHRKRLLTKMEMSNNAELIKYALLHGLTV
ncbi:response regulator [Alteromonas lipolytica]|uniref:DNA-binding response regulator n=1 Tax=Alteromonas lipolytica TaxID=1856405 RepID=A0A1E8FC26_9ALTE|nr:response regulator transcription factor [Alteromonas lipolytica]OFI33471.1 hypothetical protein BFC17_04215 [Alteromonas lipolytica]GGF59400.1 DNA-binding response regulator [Alteromonas lipolytica]